MRPVDLHMTSRAVVVLRVQIMLRTSRLNGPHVVRDAVTSQTELRDGAELQQPRMRRTMRRVTSRTAISLQRRMFESERALLVCVTLNARGVGAGGQSRLLEFKTTVRVVTITALHHSFENLVMKRLVEIGLRFRVATDAELRLARLQQVDRGDAWLLSIRRHHAGD